MHHHCCFHFHRHNFNACHSLCVSGIAMLMHLHLRCVEERVEPGRLTGVVLYSSGSLGIVAFLGICGNCGIPTSWARRAVHVKVTAFQSLGLRTERAWLGGIHQDVGHISMGEYQHLQEGLEKTPTWSPGKVLPISIDNPDSVVCFLWFFLLLLLTTLYLKLERNPWFSSMTKRFLWPEKEMIFQPFSPRVWGHCSQPGLAGDPHLGSNEKWHWVEVGRQQTRASIPQY